MNDGALWLGEHEVAELIDLNDAIAAVEHGFALEDEGAAANMAKAHVAWPGGGLHAIGAVSVNEGLACAKTWVHAGGGAAPLVTLFDARDGSLSAVIEGFVLGQLRTAAVSGLATRAMSASEADELALIGAGHQALGQLAAVAAVRPLKRVRVFSRSVEKARAFAARASAEFGLPVTGVDSVERAVEGAPLITLVTRATRPFLASQMVARGAHVNAIGAITPERMEFAPALLDRCSLIVTDSVAQARTLSAEFINYFGSDEERWKRVVALCRIAASDGGARGDDLTLFKAMGVGIADLSLAAEIHRRALKSGAGRRLKFRERAVPRLGSRTQDSRAEVKS